MKRCNKQRKAFERYLFPFQMELIAKKEKLRRKIMSFSVMLTFIHFSLTEATRVP